MTKTVEMNLITRDKGMGRKDPDPQTDAKSNNGMTDEERYLFDLQGYIILKDVISPELIENGTRILKHLEETDSSKYPPPVILSPPP